ncbi:hypothetical protein CDCA_CDCA05G1639 [Cyanidium caldarium]|uniref:Ubiquinone biosynthesis protein n=1 Tax=Cyanidium caldarium TaxID=2771 RepID=A0AAV9ITP2_CYACA|nr:hypothetical protein CDCA_CDCA05G1639 [Cyanidium caldarium]
MMRISGVSLDSISRLARPETFSFSRAVRSIPTRPDARLLTTAQSDASEGDPREHLLETCLVHDVPHHGFTTEALMSAARRLSLSPAAHALVSRGPIELVEAVLQRERHQVHQRLLRDCDYTLVDKRYRSPSSSSSSASSLRARALAFVQTRLRLRQPYRGHWHQAMALQALPQHWESSWQWLALTVDDMAVYLGDASADTRWYVRRAALATLLPPIELHWIAGAHEEADGGIEKVEDAYSDFRTWRFAERLLGDDAPFMRAWHTSALEVEEMTAGKGAAFSPGDAHPWRTVAQAVARTARSWIRSLQQASA